MKSAKYLVVTIPIVCASLCLMSEALFAGPQIYTLVVRGGGVVNPKPKGVSSDVVDVTIDFASGTKPAGIALSPGQGAWTNRGMSPDEPKRLSFRTTRRQSGEIVSSLKNPKVKWSFSCYNTGKGYMRVTNAVQVAGPKSSVMDDN